MSANRLEMHNISLAFSGFQALNKVDFTLHGGSVHALTGANGAGKSTLMAVLCGTHAHYEGEVTINNLPVIIRSPRDAKQLGIHLVQQEVDVALVPGLSIAENIMLDRLAEPGMTFRWSRVRQLAREALAQLETAPGGKLTASHSAVLSPFDPVVWDRKRAEQLFNFSYRLECYTPAPKRQYGYFVLPLLHQGKLVGRMDSKIHRKSRELEIFALWLEEGVKITSGLEQGLRRAINDFAHWQSAERILCRRLPEGLFVGQEQGWEIDAD